MASPMENVNIASFIFTFDMLSQDRPTLREAHNSLKFTACLTMLQVIHRSGMRDMVVCSSELLLPHFSNIQLIVMSTLCMR